MDWIEVIKDLGIPAVLGSIICIFLNHVIKKSDEKQAKKDKEREETEKARIKVLEEREDRTENLLMAMLSSQRATNTLASATAKAVQRIPDAHCNGDMKSALEEAAKCQEKEVEFLTKIGIQALNK